MSRKYFGTDGIRGRVGQHPITPDFVLKLGFAAGKVLSRADIAPPHRSRPAVLIGCWPTRPRMPSVPKYLRLI